jgi:hypothetical protein
VRRAYIILHFASGQLNWFSIFRRLTMELSAWLLIAMQSFIAWILARRTIFLVMRLWFSFSSYATLGLLAFDGASKRNHPNLQPGSLVYCRILTTNKDLEPAVTCEGMKVLSIDMISWTFIAPSHMTKKDWMTGHALYGELCSGFVFKSSISLSKR